jgi:hypothetical protein
MSDGSEAGLAGRRFAKTGVELIGAAFGGETAQVRSLLSGPDMQHFINYRTEKGGTALFYAAQQGHVPVTEQLIAARCGIDVPDASGASPLSIAAHQAALRNSASRWATASCSSQTSPHSRPQAAMQRLHALSRPQLPPPGRWLALLARVSMWFKSMGRECIVEVRMHTGSVAVVS